MGEPQFQTHIDNDIADPKGRYNDNDIVRSFEEKRELEGKVLQKITKYRLDQVTNYLFAGNTTISDCSEFINPALKQIERFMYVWMYDFDDETRKIVACHQLEGKLDYKTAYKKYLQTPLWKFQSCFFKLAYDFTCQNCQSHYCPPHLVVHHLSYEHIGSEFCHPEDVIVLCTDCHMKVHNVRREK